MHRHFALVLALLGPAVLATADPALSQSCQDRTLDYAARIPLCDQALAAAQTDADAAFALSMKGESQRMLGDLDGAAATLARALLHAPDNAWVWVELGNVRFDQRDIAGALAHYSAALAVEDYAVAWANRAEAWWEFRMDRNCVDDADQALRLDPRYAFANEIKGRCLIDLGRAEEALGYFDTAIALSPGYQNAYRNKMSALSALGRHPEVVALGDQALKPGTVANPNPAIEEDILSRRLLALARYAPMAGLAPEAEALLSRSAQNLTGLSVLARVRLAEARVQEAGVLAETLRQNPERRRMEPFHHETLAQVDVALGRLDTAFAGYQTALEMDPGLSRIYARKLSELGFLPLSNDAQSVLTALRRCLNARKTACLVTS